MNSHQKGVSESRNRPIRRKPYLSLTSIGLTVGLGLSAACGTAAVAETRQHGSHEHGSAMLNVAIADTTLSVEYITPAANIVGFEHAPSTEEQQHAVHEAVKLLERGKVLSLPAEAECNLTRAEVELEGEAHMDEHKEGERHEEHAQEEDNEHEKRRDDEDSHSEFHAEYEYQCENMGALAHIDVELFKHFPGNEKITTQVITANGQKGVELTPDSTRLILP